MYFFEFSKFISKANFHFWNRVTWRIWKQFLQTIHRQCSNEFVKCVQCQNILCRCFYLHATTLTMTVRIGHLSSKITWKLNLINFDSREWIYVYAGHFLASNWTKCVKRHSNWLYLDLVTNGFVHWLYIYFAIVIVISVCNVNSDFISLRVRAFDQSLDFATLESKQFECAFSKYFIKIIIHGFG